MSEATTEQKEFQINDLAQQFIDALHALEQGSQEQGNEEQANQLAMLFADEATLTNAALELRGERVEGRDAVLRFWLEYKSTLGEVVSNFHHITTSERAAGLFWTTKGQNPDGQDVHYHGATLLEWNPSGMIQFFRGYYDTRELTVKPATQ